MHDNEIQIRARTEDSFGGVNGDVSLYFFQRTDGKVTHRAEAIQFNPVDNRHDHMPPTTRIYKGQAQQLMDDLWECGLRPSEGTGSAGAFAALQQHRDDLRKIAFKKLGIDGS